MRLRERLVAIHRTFAGAGIEHAFGGAIALAYWTDEPRGTRDIDVNVFTSPEHCERVLAALPDGVPHDDHDVETIRRDGQVRLKWDDTPVDLFFSNLPIHDEAHRHRRTVPFEGTDIPILGPDELALFKARFDRTRDWADIEAMLTARTLDPDTLRDALIELLGPGDARLGRLDEALARSR